MRRANTAKDKPETTMTRFFIAGIAVLLMATSAAHAAEIPKQYRGTWCYTEWQTIYERCSGKTGIVFTEIKSTAWGSDCTLTAISKSKHGGHRLLGTCRSADPTSESRRKPTEERAGGLAATTQDCRS
jgi:hypothetical protein